MEVRVGESNPQDATPKIDQVVGVPPDFQNVVAHTYLVAVVAWEWSFAHSKSLQMRVGPSSVLCVELFLPVSVNGGGYRVDWGPAKKESVANPAYFVWWVSHEILCHVQKLLPSYTHCHVICDHRQIPHYFPHQSVRELVMQAKRSV